jgi:hypothetical protein
MSEPQKHHDPQGEGDFHVNERKGRVNALGEDLLGKEILDRVHLSFEKYELFPVEHGKAGPEIPPDATHRVKPGDHFRATIRNTDYSCMVAV